MSPSDVTTAGVASAAKGPTVADRVNFRYWAFISYSQHDAAWAKRLHAFLESYRIPRALVGRKVGRFAIPTRLLPIFLDRDELPGSPDLGATLEEALAASRSLIVICSPHSAKSTWVGEEVRSWKAMGRADRIFPLIVDGEPFASDHPEAAPAECFPPALRNEVTREGAITGRRTEPLAADARQGGDGWDNAALKVVAGILGLGFDDLRQREAMRLRHRRVVRAAMAVVATIVACLFYAALADADVSIPAGHTIRTQLDHFGWTLFRPVLTQRDMQRRVVNIRERLRERLFASVATGELENSSNSWTIGQVVAAAFRDHDTPARDLKALPRLFDLLFLSPGADKPVGSKLVESSDDAGNPGRAEPILWVIIALSTAIARPDVLSNAEIERLKSYLSIALSTADAYYSLDGGWNTSAYQLDPARHFVYTTAMALHALLEVQAAKLNWRDNGEHLDKIIANTAKWLIGNFVNDPPGWRRSADDDREPDSGITLLVYSALGRACEVAHVPIPDSIRTAALDLQAGLRFRRYESADPDIRFDVGTSGANGRRYLSTQTRMIWYPWAVAGLVSWRRCAEKLHLPPETKRTLDRSLGHLLAKVAPDMLRDVTRPGKPSWVGAETYYALDDAP